MITEPGQRIALTRFRDHESHKTRTSPTDVWAVGQTQTEGNSVIATLTEHFNGRSWSVVPSSDPGLLGNDSLDGVASAGGGQLLPVPILRLGDSANVRFSSGVAED